ncbi:GIY-YIG nuclease family protein [Pseudanabaena sp. PCC 6802]|uniref:GIY-YIG nuclease family protein n=1 Tax=Pseudanabaena sp. PCC 6802 TaxID=118173 RepID=UPI0003492803|nr:GIY-YIG nuclease family protein [Pseudanabaena sp. PCC 6802]
MADVIPPLTEIPFAPYLDESGNISPALEGKIGVYAIFDADKCLRYVGISRDIASSLKLHIVRVPSQCHWLKFTTVTKPSRTVLSEIQAAWFDDLTADTDLWEQPLDCRRLMNDDEKHQLEQAINEAEQEKVLKNVARRVEKDILAQLAERGAAFEVRFNPKRKSEGILDIK